MINAITGNKNANAAQAFALLFLSFAVTYTIYIRTKRKINRKKEIVEVFESIIY
jgi:hypothetical protein